MKNPKIWARVALFIAVVTTSLYASAQRFSFLDDTVLSGLSSAEIQSFRDLVRITLDESPDTELILWRSPSGQKEGKILPRFTYETNGTICRRTSFQVSEVDGRLENYRFDLCQSEDGWGIANSPGTFTGPDRERLENFLSKALDELEDGLPLTWTGRELGHNAVIVPIATEDPIDNNCRLAALTIIDREGQALNGQYQFCKNESDAWEYKPDTELVEANR